MIKNNVIDDLIESEAIFLLDKQAAIYLASEYADNLSIVLFLIYLFSSSRRGHLCVDLTVLKPSLQEVWQSEKIDWTQSEYFELENSIKEGFESLPDSFFGEDKAVVRENTFVYLQKNWFLENEIFKYFSQVYRDSPKDIIEVSFEESSLLSKQKQAIQCSLDHCLSFIIGGPGVGKTYCATELVKSFLEKQPDSKVALLAPTGKAAFNLENSLSKLINLSAVKNQIEVATLHKVFYKKEHSFLPYDLILVDESSMIDIKMMINLFKYHKRGSRLVLLGDKNQLLPVESGSIFIDLLHLSENKVELTDCMRTEVREIINVASALQEGNEKEFFSILEEKKKLRDLNLKDRSAIMLSFAESFPRVIKKDQSFVELLDAFQQFKVLSPMRKGPFGVNEINNDIHHLLSPAEVVPIMIQNNDYQLELFNGDLGIIVNRQEAIFPIRKEDQKFSSRRQGVRVIPVSLLSSFEYAYCISVHKSQGSEYQNVKIILPSGCECFGREMLYTAITRAKKDFEIFSNNSTLRKLVQTKNFRQSAIHARRIHGKS